MKEKIQNFEWKYECQNELVDSGVLEPLDERILHETIKAMLINTTNDCIKFEIALDPEMELICRTVTKDSKTEDDIKKIKHAQDRLRMYLHLASISEDALETLLYQMLFSDKIKYAFKQDIPELFESLYYMIDIEDDIVDNLITEITECDDELSYKQICGIINSCIADMVENAEEYVDDIQERKLYDEFVINREKWRINKKENANE